MFLKQFVLMVGLMLQIAIVFADTGPRVVASFSVLGDLVTQVGGDRITLQVLVGPDQDAHVYQPSPVDAQQFSAAHLVVVNGLGFEGWIDRLIQASGYRGAVAVATRDIPDLFLERGRLDPHAWQNPRHVHHYVQNITKALVAIDPSSEDYYHHNAKIFLKQLEQLDQEIKNSIAALPQDRRTVITSHDAFAYFGQAYGLNFVAPQRVNTNSEASASDVAALIRQIRRDKIPAVFLENINDPRLLQQIARETGVRMGGTLYSDALSLPSGDAGSYLAMMRHNLRVLVKALQAPVPEN